MRYTITYTTKGLECSVEAGNEEDLVSLIQYMGKTGRIITGLTTELKGS
jgi:hypothetical protein